MGFDITKNDNYSVVKINAEKLDSNISPALKSELLVLSTDGVKNIIIDLSATRYCDSSGLSAILVGNRLCRNSNGTFVISGLQAPVMKLINISQLDSVLNIATDVAEGAATITLGTAKK